MEKLQEVWVRESGLPHPCQADPARDLGQRILIATDFSPSSLRVQAHALALAAASHAALLVIVIQDDARTGEAAQRRMLDELASEGRERGIEVEVDVASGDPVQAMLDLAAQRRATGILVADDQWMGALPHHPCLCAPLITRGSLPVLVMHAAGTTACGVRSSAA